MFDPLISLNMGGNEKKGGMLSEDHLPKCYHMILEVFNEDFESFF